MSYSVYLLFVLTATTSMSMAVEEFRLLETVTSFDKETADTVKEKKFNETTIQKSYTTIEQDNIVHAMNNLRRSVGASDMTHLYWNTNMESDAMRFTANCNYDIAAVSDGWGYKTWSPTSIDPVASIQSAFRDPDFSKAMRSVYLIGMGDHIRFCTTATKNRIRYYNIYIGAVLFSHTSYFNEILAQYTLGEECTTCRSGRFWCYEGLCKDDCSASDSSCYCYPYCLNCASTNQASCTCQCLQGWTNSRCETSSGINATTPTCSATPRGPRTSTTTTTTPAASRPTSFSGSLIGMSMCQLAFYATVALYLRYEI